MITRRLLLAVALYSMTGLSVFAADAPNASHKVVRTMSIGGAGGWDYATLDDDGARLFLTRATHTMVIDPATGKTLADIGPSKRAHGVALASELARGFITDGDAGNVIIFDLKTYQELGRVAAAEDADGIIYDPASQHVWVACGDSKVVVPIAAGVDPKSGKSEMPIDLGGKPEFLTADGKGRLYIAIQDKAEVGVIDTKAMKLIGKWPTAPGALPTGISIDPANGRLFVGCRNQKLIVMSTQDGAVLADLPIGGGVDATAFHNGAAMASCSDGTLTVVRETSPQKFEVVETVKTALGARTMAVDQRTGAIYLPTADMGAPTKPGGRPKPLPNTFKILVVADEK